MNDSPYEFSEQWLKAQEAFLKGLELHWEVYLSELPRSDHEHCEFCCAKFMEGGVQNTLAAGYASDDLYRWICPDCYERFKDRFCWSLRSE